jgi:hypothetical protein
MRAASQIVTHHPMTFVLLFMRACVPTVSNMINYIFSNTLGALQWKATILAARNKALC